MQTSGVFEQKWNNRCVRLGPLDLRIALELGKNKSSMKSKLNLCTENIPKIYIRITRKF